MKRNSGEHGRALARAHELYWESDESVNQIAEQLDLSKSSLYNLIAPLSSGLPCPRCSADMEYRNRTARDKGFLTCSACDLEEDAESVKEEWREVSRDAGGDALVVRPGAGAGARRALTSPTGMRRRSRVILGTALLGAACGLALALWARRE